MKIPERDATPDEAFSLGAVSGYDDGYKDGHREALEEAAERFYARLPDGTGNGRAYNSYTVARMLRAMADGGN